MSSLRTARIAVSPFFALILASCAAERLEARDPDRGPTGTASPTSPIERPTRLQATEHQLAPTPTPDAPGTALYVCPMHPEVQSPRPGVCPKCGMKLQQQERSR